jgi:CRP-like cAMP-binding protein
MLERKRRGPTKTTKAVKAAYLDPAFVTSGFAGFSSDPELNARDMVFSQGDPADAVFYIETGRVQLTIVSDQGKEGVIALLGPGDFFGEGCLSGQPRRLASAVAIAASSLIRIEKEAMIRRLHEDKVFSEKFMAFLMTRNIQVEADLVDQLFNSSEKRLARVLLLLANFDGEGTLRPIVPKVSQDILAARVGTTRSRVNQFMNKFRRLGLIEYNGDIKVHAGLINVIVHD